MRDDHHTDDEALADLADVILAIARTLSAHVRADPRSVHLTATEINVMRYIDHHPDCSPSTVAAATGLQRSNLSKALRSLEANGLVRKTADDSDGRQAVLTPTPRAAENLAWLRSQWSRMLSDAAGPDSGLDIDTALAVLGALEAGLTVGRSDPGRTPGGTP